jgi:hypothetical protein
MKCAIGTASSPVAVEPGGGERFCTARGGFATHMLIVQLPGDEFSVDFFPERLTSVKQATNLLARGLWRRPRYSTKNSATGCHANLGSLSTVD